jgi:hypothetical protein
MPSIEGAPCTPIESVSGPVGARLGRKLGSACAESATNGRRPECRPTGVWFLSATNVSPWKCSTRSSPPRRRSRRYSLMRPVEIDGQTTGAGRSGPVDRGGGRAVRDLCLAIRARRLPTRAQPMGRAAAARDRRRSDPPKRRRSARHRYFRRRHHRRSIQVLTHAWARSCATTIRDRVLE